MKKALRSEGRLLLAAVVLVALMNVPYGRYALYPFALFTTWIHEMWHGLAAIGLGGSIETIRVFSDTSGLAYTVRPVGRIPTAIVASAGYVGTAVTGAVMLALRNRRHAGSIGLSLLGGMMLLSTLLWVRNLFGLVAIPLLGVGLLAAARWSTEAAGRLYTFLAVTCCLNAITSIRDLFSPNLVVAGKPAGSSDAQTVAEALLLPAPVWAASWLALAVVLVGASLYVSRSR